MRLLALIVSSFRQKWRSRPGDGAGSFDPVVGDGEGGDSTGFLLRRVTSKQRA